MIFVYFNLCILQMELSLQVWNCSVNCEITKKEWSVDERMIGTEAYGWCEYRGTRSVS